jgi:hypothetical protein
MTRPFKGVINLDIRVSKPDWDAFLENKAPKDAPNVLVIGYDGGDAVSGEYKPKFPFSDGRFVKVVFDLVDYQYVDIERKFAAAMAGD